MLAKQAQRETREAEKMSEKARKAVLKGKVGFAKQVWKELSMGPDVFS